MEVHHHPHVEKKNFKEYLLEFLMISLAVTLGFFAENIRENISDNEHAKLLTEQLVKDLKSDTDRLAFTINFETDQRKIIDTLFSLLQQPVTSADTKYIQQLIVNIYVLKVFNPSNGAISAIEKELSVKQFSGSQLPAFISEYNHLASINKEIEDLVFRLIEQNIEPFMNDHFEPANAYNVLIKNGSVTEAKMRNLTQEDMTKLSVQIAIMSNTILSLTQMEEKLKAQAQKTIEYVIKQYRLANSN